MSEHDTVPAAEIDSAASATPLSDIIGSDRHQTVSEHVVEVEAGAPTPEPAPAPSAQPAPKAETAAPAAATTPDPVDDPRSPRWFREEMKRQRAENARLRAVAEGRASGPPPPPQQQRRREPELPDPEQDPVGHRLALYDQHRQRVQEMEREQLRTELRLEYSADRLMGQHGEDTLEEVREWLRSKAAPDGANPMEAWAMAQRDPWGSAHQQMARERLADEIGSDPEAYKRRLREEWEAEQAAKESADPQHVPARTTMTPARTPPPPPASTVRNALDRDDRGRFTTGPTPMSAILNRQKA
jgi:hypothetical protein